MPHVKKNILRHLHMKSKRKKKMEINRTFQPMQFDTGNRLLN